MMHAEASLVQQIRRGTGAQRVLLGERIQTLWSGYGELRSVLLGDAEGESHAVVKIVAPPAERELRGDAAKLRSHRRKLRSYAVELEFYRSFAARCDAACRVPRLLHGAAQDERFLLVLEDLNAAGFPARRRQCTEHEVLACLSWLAVFHARFLGMAPDGLWRVGTYWHLATRPDELRALEQAPLRRAAPKIDQRLNAARFKTLLHGDAKLENFCFSRSGAEVAAVDFQYAGGGVGVKDVAYFLSSCLSPRACEREVPRYLDRYFELLRGLLSGQGAPSEDAAALEHEWRELFPWAWVDFHRFMLGWGPSFAVDDEYSERLTLELLAALEPRGFAVALRFLSHSGARVGLIVYHPGQ